MDDERFVRLALKYVAEKHRSGDWTQRSARNARSILIHYLSSSREISLRSVQAFLDMPGSAGTKRARLSTLRGFFDWCVLNGELKRNPTTGAKGPRNPKRAPRSLTSVAAEAIARGAPDERARLIVLLMLQEGLRCIEVSRAEMGDVDERSRIMAVRGKGGREGVTRHVPLSEETSLALERYLALHPASAGPLIRSYHHADRPISSSHIGKLVGDWMREAGVKQRAWDGKAAHSLRHTMATDMAQGGRNIFEIQRALGHADLSSTQIYVSGVTPELREAMGGRSYLRPADVST